MITEVGSQTQKHTTQHDTIDPQGATSNTKPNHPVHRQSTRPPPSHTSPHPALPKPRSRSPSPRQFQFHLPPYLPYITYHPIWENYNTRLTHPFHSISSHPIPVRPQASLRAIPKPAKQLTHPNAATHAHRPANHSAGRRGPGVAPSRQSDTTHVRNASAGWLGSVRVDGVK